MSTKKKNIKTNNWVALIISILICQMAGIIGSLFTTSSIPTWYMSLDKPSFNPPNWIFGPVWTLLYTLMGISLYKIWLKRKSGSSNEKRVSFALKVFGIHLVLNSLWSIIFFGFKNPGAAFIEIVILWAMIIYVVKLFWKIEKVAGILLLPYLLWVSFAMILNLSIWTLNPKPISVYAQDLTYERAYSDYSFTKDKYTEYLKDFNSKKDSYLKNPTLSLKEELRISLYSFLIKRNNLITTYLTSLRLKTLESNGLTKEEKDSSLSGINEEYKWFLEKINSYNENDSLEDLLSKSADEDSRFSENTTARINFALILISFGDISEIEKEHKDIYDNLKSESDNLVSLGRADVSLFDRWFKDIEAKFNSLSEFKNTIKSSFEELISSETYIQKRAFQRSIENLEPAKNSLLKVNEYLYELENVINDKR